MARIFERLQSVQPNRTLFSPLYFGLRHNPLYRRDTWIHPNIGWSDLGLPHSRVDYYELNQLPGELAFLLIRDGKAGSLVADWLYKLITDKNGNIWIASANSGVSRYNPKDDLALNFVHSDTDIHSLSSNKTFDIYEDAGGDIWIATDEGLNLFVPETNNFIRYTNLNTDLPENIVISVYQTREGKYWVGTMSGLASGMKTDFNKFDQSQGNLSNDSVNSFTESGDGSLWVGTDNSLNRLRPGSTKFEWINQSSEPAISDSRVMSLYSDQNTLWVGTYEGGLNKVDLITGDTHDISTQYLTTIHYWC